MTATTIAAGAAVTPMSRKRMALIALGVLAAALTLRFTYESYMYVATDNAMVQAHATLISPQVRGVIVRADVEENQKGKG